MILKGKAVKNGKFRDKDGIHEATKEHMVKITAFNNKAPNADVQKSDVIPFKINGKDMKLTFFGKAKVGKFEYKGKWYVITPENVEVLGLRNSIKELSHVLPEKKKKVEVQPTTAE